MPILVSVGSDRARRDLVTDTEELQAVDGVRRHQYAGAELIWCAHALIERCAKAVTLKRQGRAQASNAGPNDENVADVFALHNVEVVFHQAASTKDLDLMMSLFADGATLSAGGKTYTGKDQVRSYFATAWRNSIAANLIR